MRKGRGSAAIVLSQGQEPLKLAIGNVIRLGWGFEDVKAQRQA